MSTPAYPSLIAQARGLIDVKRPADALPLLARAIAIDPDDARAHCLYSLALLLIWEAGVPGSLRSGAVAPKDVLPTALAEAERAAALDPSSDWPHRLRSLTYRHMGRPRLAVAAAQDAVRLSPSIGLGLLSLGDAQMDAGDVDEAEMTARRLVEREPEDANSHALLGRVALKQKKWPDAEAAFREAVRLDPRSWSSIHNLALALSHQGQRQESVRLYAEALRLNPTSKVSQQGLFLTLRRYGGISIPLIVLYWAARLVFANDQPTRSVGLVLVAVVLGAMVIGALARRSMIRRHHPEMEEFYRHRSTHSWFAWRDRFGFMAARFSRLWRRILRR